MRWEDCVKRDLAGVRGEIEGEGKRGVENVGGDGSEMGLVMKGKKNGRRTVDEEIGG